VTVIDVKRDCRTDEIISYHVGSRKTKQWQKWLIIVSTSRFDEIPSIALLSTFANVAVVFEFYCQIIYQNADNF